MRRAAAGWWRGDRRGGRERSGLHCRRDHRHHHTLEQVHRLADTQLLCRAIDLVDDSATAGVRRTARRPGPVPDRRPGSGTCSRRTERIEPGGSRDRHLAGCGHAHAVRSASSQPGRYPVPAASSGRRGSGRTGHRRVGSAGLAAGVSAGLAARRTAERGNGLVTRIGCGSAAAGRVGAQAGCGHGVVP